MQNSSSHKISIFKSIVLFFITCLLLFLGSFAFAIEKHAESNHNSSQVSFVYGQCYLQPKEVQSGKTLELSSGVKITQPLPYALVARENSYLELLDFPQPNNVTRIGQSTAIEIRDRFHLYFFQGSSLISQRENTKWTLETNSTLINTFGYGTWMVETTDQMGFKIVLLEGKLAVFQDNMTVFLNSGDLLLISEIKGQISQKIKIDLPLLLQTCRLLNNFKSELTSNSRIISAARVQAMRLKKRFEAVVGGVKNNKLQIWAIKKN